MTSRFTLFLCLTTATWLSGCKDRDAHTDAVDAPAPASQAALDAATREAPTARPPAPLGEWQDSAIYRIRLVDARPCAGSDETKTGNQRPPRYRLGVTAEVEAITEQLWVTPKAFTLEKNGAVIQGQLKAKASPGCEDPLAPQRLVPGSSLRTTIIFEVPDESYARSAQLAFRPPRWRLAPRVAVQLPDCFDCDRPAKLTSLDAGKD